MGIDSTDSVPGLDSNLIEESKSSRIASPSRRFFAFAVDACIIGFLGALIGAFLFETLAQLGQTARLIGLLISLLYFGLFESTIGDGQTPGKRLLKVRLVNSRGDALSFEQSILRFFVFGVPFLANGLTLPITHGVMLFTAIMGLVVFGLGGANLYLMLFNLPQHQGLHDVVVESYVVHADPKGVVAGRRIWRGHWLILGAFALLLAALPQLIMSKITNRGSFPRMLEDGRRVMEIQGVQNVSVREVSVFHSGVQTSDRIFSVEVMWAGPAENEEALADEIAKNVLLNDPNVANYSKLRIAITRGYDLGIGSRWYSRAFAFSPDEWRQRLL